MVERELLRGNLITGDVFVVMNPSDFEIIQWNGQKSNPEEREIAKKFIEEEQKKYRTEKKLKLNHATVDEGKFDKNHKLYTLFPPTATKRKISVTPTVVWVKPRMMTGICPSPTCLLNTVKTTTTATTKITKITTAAATTTTTNNSSTNNNDNSNDNNKNNNNRNNNNNDNNSSTTTTTTTAAATTTTLTTTTATTTTTRTKAAQQQRQ
ncbi:hypothetical protein AC249_AIPGENE18218 [Exaiptasia diaphana]|nr:hypothetical protein AC249_AIPGENE18218 [Exaiptasia diaphana]